jgi:mannose-1-phosphate guanylyltransferase
MLHAVIMAGGSGTRFWPKSRRSRPKQLLPLFGDATMLQQTVARIEPLVPLDRILLVTGADQAEASAAQLPRLPEGNLVAEPCPRDTAACVGLAAALIARRDPDATLAVLPADHVVRPAETFRNTLAVGVAVVEDDPTAFVTMGIPPTRPETGYGYIERGPFVDRREGVSVHRVVQFREKPDRATAESFLARGNFAWNSGVFLWKARAILDALRTHRPALAEGIARIADAQGTPGYAEVLAREFPKLERVPIDKAVMEKASNVLVLEVSYEWSDVGDWRSLAELLRHDSAGNVVQGPVHLLDAKDTVVIADDGRLIAALGVSDLVIVQSQGATLVAHKSQLDRLKTLVEGLDEAGHGADL